MSEQKIYFQWQNEVLKDTIYPLREMKLRHVLEYYMEIDLWKQYKDKKIEDISDEVKTYHEKKEAVIKKAVDNYKDQLDYFYNLEMPALAPDNPVDESILAKIKTLHETFKTYYKDLADSFRQSYFISQRLETIDQARKELDKSIAAQKRYLDAIKAGAPNHPNIPTATEKLKGLENAQPLLEEQRKQLVALVSAFGKLENRKKEYRKRVDTALKREKEIRTRLDPIRRTMNLQEEKLRAAREDLQRLRTPPETAPLLESYFSTQDVTSQILNLFKQVDASFLNKVNSIHLEIFRLNDRQVKRSSLRNHIFNVQLEKTRFERRTGLDATFRENTLSAYDYELKCMRDFWSVLDRERKTADVLNQEIQAREAEVAQLQNPDVMKSKEAEELQSQLNELDSILNVTEEKYISEYTPVQPMVKDMALLRMDDYRDSLKDLNQYQLLELIVGKFKKEPERYSRWLQYMIIHFSGMRYASAHGSWADPKDLYMNLRTAMVANELRTWNDDIVERKRDQKLAEYDPTQKSLFPGLEIELPKLAKTKDIEWREKIERHLLNLKSDNPYLHRTGLLNLLLDEENYTVELMKAKDVLAALEELREEAKLPDWMWKEITAVTELRLKQAKDKSWDKLTAEEQQAKSSAEAAKYREIMNKWKQDNLTGWREEHEHNAQFIVSRAVCNEVAEHILHLRGHEGHAGLASAQDWYISRAPKAGKRVRGDNGSAGSYFVKPQKIEDYCPGAAILWLRYRNDPPPVWNIVKPFVTISGDKLLPDNYLNGGRWSYKNSGLDRSRTFKNEKGLNVKSNQYLYWVHIATVAEVAETAEGPVVLTFETALPYEDRRLSGVGLFKHYDYNILFDGGEDTYNGSFVGYVPDNLPDVPTEDLDAMLNWDHILLK